jgi:outer membrane lipoprotein-sorting protein
LYWGLKLFILKFHIKERYYPMKKIACMAVCIALLIFFMAPVASAQILDDVWFEVKVKLSGYQVTSENEIFKVNRGSTAYIYTNSYTDTAAYDYEIWTEQNPGDWQRTYSSRHDWIVGNNEELWHYWSWLLFVGNNESATTVMNVLMKITTETDGSFKNAKFSSLGCTVIGGQLNNLPFYGNCKVSGKSIKPTKLPFTPPP